MEVVTNEGTIKVQFCVVIPCYNEEDMLPTLFAAITPVLEEATAGQWAILCVDDGSRDATFATIEEWHMRDRRICGIQLSRNFGHQSALSVGLTYAHGQYIGIMDCDMQDPIDVLMELYRSCVHDELDVCYGIRAQRKASPFARAAYSLFYRIINRVAEHEWPRDAGDFCVMSVRCQKTLLALPEQSRMLRGLRSWVGLRQSGIRYARPSRLRGKSKYSISRLIVLALQGLISFSHVPLRLASFMGVGMGVFSVLFGTLVVVNRLLPRFTLFGYWIGASPGLATLGVFLSFALSVLFICLGILGEYLIVLLQEIKKRPSAIVSALVGKVEPYSSSYFVIQAAAERTRAYTSVAR